MLLFLVWMSAAMGGYLSDRRWGFAAWHGALTLLYMFLIYSHFRTAFKRHRLANELFEMTSKMVERVREEIEAHEAKVVDRLKDKVEVKSVRRSRRTKEAK